MTAQTATLFDPGDYEDGWRDCPRCIMLGFPGRYPEVFFRVSDTNPGWEQDLAPKYRRHRLCMGCEDEIDEDRDLRISLNQRIRDHAKRHGTPIAIYRERYGVDSDAVLAWFKAKIRSGLLDCGCLVSEMKHGNKDIEMHQMNPAEPFFPATWQLVCTNDHRQMQHPEHAAKKRGWELWKKARE